jgi:hypothetical protein
MQAESIAAAPSQTREAKFVIGLLGGTTCSGEDV